MIPATLDSNILLSGFLNEATPPGQVLNAWRDGRFELVISEPILTEVANTFQDPYFRRRLTPEEMAADLRLLREGARLVAITAEVKGVATHPEDDFVLATARSGQAAYIVTGDKQLLRLAAFDGIRILRPQAFLDALDPI